MYIVFFFFYKFPFPKKEKDNVIGIDCLLLELVILAVIDAVLVWLGSILVS